MLGDTQLSLEQPQLCCYWSLSFAKCQGLSVEAEGHLPHLFLGTPAVSMHVSMHFPLFLCIAAPPLLPRWKQEERLDVHLPVTCNAADGQGFTERFRKRWNILHAGVCLHTACWPGTGGRSQTSSAELWSSVTWKIPLVPVQGQLLVPVAVTERVAGPGLPDQPHPHCP